MNKKICDISKNAIWIVIIVCYALFVITNSQIVSKAIIASIYRCINIIIPSLFAFIAISTIIVNSRIYTYISKPFYPLTKLILKMPNELFFVFILGNIAGYPVGINLLSSLVNEKKIDKKTAEIMSCYCYAGGPAFLIGAVGISIFNNSKIGLLIFYSIIITNLLIAIFLNRIFKIECNEIKTQPQMTSDVLIKSVESAGKALFKMCVMIIFFSTLMVALDRYSIIELLQTKLNFSDNISVLIKSIFEITAVTELTGLPFKLIPIIASVCGLGGICVIFQVISINQKAFSLKKFYISRIISLPLNALICCVLLHFYNIDAIVVSTIQPKLIVEINNFVPSICLILMIFSLAFKKRLVIYK